jgi:fructokinase
MAFIAMPDVNSYEIVFYRNPGADTRLRAEELDRELLQSTKAFHFGSLSLIEEPSRTATLEAVKLSKAAGALISFDVNYRSLLWSREAAYDRVMATLPHVDLLKINEGELALLTGSEDPADTAKSLLEKGPQLVVVTLGPEGSYFQTAEGGRHLPAFKVDTVDATGCGDAFIAGLLWQFISHGDWREQLSVERMGEVLHYANAVGALTAQGLGVIPSLPTAADVEEFLSELKSRPSIPSSVET